MLELATHVVHYMKRLIFYVRSLFLCFIKREVILIKAKCSVNVHLYDCAV